MDINEKMYEALKMVRKKLYNNLLMWGHPVAWAVELDKELELILKEIDEK